MSITASEMTPADIAAVTNNGGNCGNSWGGGMWGDWILLFLIFGLFGFGGNGRGFGFGGGGGGGFGAPCATQADLAAGFNNSAVLSSLNDIKMGQTQAINYNNQGFSGLNTAILQGFNGVERGFCDISHQLSDCCCTTQRAIDGVNYNIAKGFCDVGNVIQSTTRDIIDNANANSRAILDFLTNDKIATLTAENQSLKFAASQSAQNAFIIANQEAQTAELIRRLGRDCPVPAYVVPNPNCCYNYAQPSCGCGTI